MDMHTHFLRDDTRNMNFVNMRNAVGKAGWNKTLAEKEQTIEDLKYANYIKEMFLDSDTKIALISSAPSDIEHDWFLTNEQMARGAREGERGGGLAPAVLAHHLHARSARLARASWKPVSSSSPKSAKGYTIGDNTHKNLSKYPWRLDDEKVAYKGYELCVKAGIKNVCVHKGLFAPSIEKQFPHLRGFCGRRRRRQGREGLAAAQLHHLPLGLSPRRRRSGGGARRVRADGPHLVDLGPRRHSGRIRREQRLRRRRPAVRHHAGRAAARLRRPDGHADQGPRRRSRLLGHATRCGPARRNGRSRACAGSRSPRTCRRSTASRRSAAPDGPVKTAIFGLNNAKLYNIQPKRAMLELQERPHHRVEGTSTRRKAPTPTNMRYGYVAGPVDHSLFA